MESVGAVRVAAVRGVDVCSTAVLFVSASRSLKSITSSSSLPRVSRLLTVMTEADSSSSAVEATERVGEAEGETDSRLRLRDELWPLPAESDVAV